MGIIRKREVREDMATIKRIEGKKGVTYKITVSNGYGVDGKQIRVSTTLKPTAKTEKAQEKEAYKYAAIFEKQVEDGKYAKGNSLKFCDFYQQWETSFGKLLTPYQYETVKMTIEREFMPYIGHLKLTEIRPMVLLTIKDNMENRGLKPASIKKYFSGLSSILQRAYTLELIENNPCNRLAFAQIEKDGKIHTFSLEQINVLYDLLENGIDVHYPEKQRKNGRIIPAHDEHIDIPTQFKAYYHLAIMCGFRRSEMIGLTWNDIDFNRREISINHATSTAKSKGGMFDKETKSKASNRIAGLPEGCVPILKEWKAEQMQLCRTLGSAWRGVPVEHFEDQYVFIQANGKQMYLSTPYGKLKDIIKYHNQSMNYQAALCPDPVTASLYTSKLLPDITLHDLRHCFASIGLNIGIDLATISEMEGHYDPSVTAKNYIHSVPGAKRAAVEALNKAVYGDKESPQDVSKSSQTMTLELSPEEYQQILQLRRNRA